MHKRLLCQKTSHAVKGHVTVTVSVEENCFRQQDAPRKYLASAKNNFVCLKRAPLLESSDHLSNIQNMFHPKKWNKPKDHYSIGKQISTWDPIRGSKPVCGVHQALEARAGEAWLETLVLTLRYRQGTSMWGRMSTSFWTSAAHLRWTTLFLILPVTPSVTVSNSHFQVTNKVEDT
jgi:hypothetical protein